MGRPAPVSSAPSSCRARTVTPAPPCRACSPWPLAPDPNTRASRVFAPQKGNSSAVRPSLAFERRTAEGQLAAPFWLGEPHLVADAPGLRPRRDTPECDRAVAFLQQLLHDGP